MGKEVLNYFIKILCPINTNHQEYNCSLFYLLSYCCKNEIFEEDVIELVRYGRCMKLRKEELILIKKKLKKRKI